MVNRRSVYGACILISCLGGMFFVYAKPLMHSGNVENNTDELTMIFVGDIMLSRKIGEIVDNNGPEFPFVYIATTTRAADIAFGNFENPVSLKGQNQGSIYSFRANPKTLDGLTFSGFDVLSLANNHILDWGEAALLDSIEEVRRHNMLPVGVGNTLSAARKGSVIEKKGMVVCIFAYSQFSGWYGSKDSSPAIAPLDLSLITEDLQRASVEGCGIKVISVHWGTEYETTASAEQRSFARNLIDAGATAVIGHHPHVMQEVEKYNGGLIAYSLGNFIFDQNFSKDTRNSAILHVTFHKNSIRDYKLIPIHFTEEYQPYEVY